MEIPQTLSGLLSPLFQELPLTSAMPELVPVKPQRAEVTELVYQLADMAVVRERPSILAGLWLYVDELDQSHQVSQGIHTVEGSLWHGIMHRREGDFWNSKYWFGKAGKNHALSWMNPVVFVERVERAYMDNPSDLVTIQRM